MSLSESSENSSGHMSSGTEESDCDSVVNPDLQPFAFLNEDESDEHRCLDTVLFMLNSDWLMLPVPSKTYLLTRFEQLWARSALKVCVDGGLKVLHSLNEHLHNSNSNMLYKPDVVCGDFDSVSNKMLEFYEHQGTQVKKTPDQNHTDFTKSIALIRKHLKCENSQGCKDLKQFVVLSGLSERFDHCMSNLNTLLQTRPLEIWPKYHTYLINDDNLYTVLHRGTNKVIISDSKYRGGHCHLQPLGKPAVVSTQNLQFNLDTIEMKIGDQLGMFNKTSVDHDYFTVVTNQDIILTMEILR